MGRDPAGRAAPPPRRPLLPGPRKGSRVLRPPPPPTLWVPLSACPALASGRGAARLALPRLARGRRAIRGRGVPGIASFPAGRWIRYLVLCCLVLFILFFMFGSVDGWKGLACIFMCDFIIFIFFFQFLS